MLGRSFMQDSDPAPTVATIKSTLKIYPYTPGGPGTSVATLLEGEIRSRRRRPRCPRPPSSRARGLTFNTIPPTDAGFFETVHALLQDEPADAADPEIIGHLAEIGIVKGKPFAPDDRMRRILDDAAAVGNATARALMFDARGEEDVAYYPGSAWTNMLFGGGYLFDRPIPLVTPEGIKPFPPTGARKHDLRTLFFYGYTGITPAMAMRLTGLGSQYLVAFMDSNKEYFDGARSYTVTLPPDIPQARFWSLTLYDNQTRSMLVTPQRYPRAGSQSYPTPAAVAERRRIDHRPLRPRAAGRRRRRQLDPDDARQGVLRRPPALQPAPAVLRQVLAGRRDHARLRLAWLPNETDPSPDGNDAWRGCRWGARSCSPSRSSSSPSATSSLSGGRRRLRPRVAGAWWLVTEHPPRRWVGLAGAVVGGS